MLTTFDQYLVMHYCAKGSYFYLPKFARHTRNEYITERIVRMNG